MARKKRDGPSEGVRERLRFILGDDDYMDLTHEEAVALRIVRKDDEHRGPVRITRAWLYEDGTTRTRRLKE